jgi:hypothetical protein
VSEFLLPNEIMAGLERSLGGLPPTEDPDPAFSDALLTETMNQLSMKEREKVLEDIHGVADIMKEEPLFVKQCLVELEQELCQISHHRDAYDAARSSSVDYVSNRSFRLQFLRADSFHVKNAAMRIVAYFQAKMDLFGLDYLTKRINQRDLDDEDRACLESGTLQLLAGRDRSGRSIAFVMPGAVGTVQQKVNYSFSILH